MVVVLLVSKGADVKAKTKDGCTVLHEAITAVGGADRGNEELVELLISMGVDSMVKNKDGKTALHLASEENNQAVVCMLKKEKWEAKRRRTSAGRRQVRQRARFFEALAHQ
jgi:ankyrin repeat protein